MYRIKKYSNCNVIHDLDNETDTVVTAEVWDKLLVEFPALKDDQLVSLFVDVIDTLNQTGVDL